VQDNHGGSASGTVDLTLNSTQANHPPVAEPDSFTGTFGQIITGNVLLNNGSGADYDPDGDALSVVSMIGTSAQGGSVVLHADGTFTYTPLLGYVTTYAGPERPGADRIGATRDNGP
jgi:hypothetical protein